MKIKLKKIGKNIDFPSNQFVNDAIKWMEYAIFQGKRTISANNDKKDRSRIYYFEKDVFVFTLNKAIYMLKISTREYSEMQKFLDIIENALGKGKVEILNDMLTHIDAYLEDSGKYQNEFVYDEGSIDSAFNGLVCDATHTTITKDGSILIGGKINVQESIRILEEVLPQVERFFESTVS